MPISTFFIPPSCLSNQSFFLFYCHQFAFRDGVALAVLELYLPLPPSASLDLGLKACVTMLEPISLKINTS